MEIQTDGVRTEEGRLPAVVFVGDAANFNAQWGHCCNVPHGRRASREFCSYVHHLDRAGLARLYFHIFLKGIKPMKTHKPALSSRLIQVEDQFVDLWDTMSRLWGISSTMARIHGLLYITGAALSMDDIMERLAISRGNVSMNLSKLVEWGLVRRVHKRGDRRDYYESLR